MAKNEVDITSTYVDVLSLTYVDVRRCTTWYDVTLHSHFDSKLKKSVTPRSIRTARTKTKSTGDSERGGTSRQPASVAL